MSFIIQLYYNLSCILYYIQDGNTSLYNVCSRGDHNTADLLIKAGAKIDIVNDVSL